MQHESVTMETGSRRGLLDTCEDRLTDQLGEVSQLSQLFRQRDQFVVAGDQNLQRQGADHRGEDRQLVPAGGGAGADESELLLPPLKNSHPELRSTKLCDRF